MTGKSDRMVSTVFTELAEANENITGLRLV